jgi:ankyrin repeat protein
MIVLECCDLGGLSSGRTSVWLIFTTSRGPWLPAAAGNLSRVQELIRKDADAVRRRDPSGYTALHYAARSGSPDAARVCEFLCKNGADVNAATGPGQASPLQRAASSGRHDNILVLLKAGAAVGARDADGKTALFRACEERHALVVDLLLKDGADPSVGDNRGRSCAEVSSPDIRLRLEKA